jgi:hypothetical protein
MGRVRILREQIRPEARAAFKTFTRGNLSAIERRMVPQMRAAFHDHMKIVVADCMAVTRVRDSKGAIRRQLINGIKIYGTRIDTLRTEVFGAEYIHAQEYGATIRPKSAKALTLPLPAALRPDGSPKFKTARAWKRYGTFTWRDKRTKRGYLAYKNAAGKLVLLYVFVNVVHLMPKLGLRKSYDRLLGLLLSEWGAIMVKEMSEFDLMGVYRNPAAYLPKAKS